MSKEVKSNESKVFSTFTSITNGLAERLERKGRKSEELQNLAKELKDALNVVFISTLGDSSVACESVLLASDVSAAKGIIAEINRLNVEHNSTK